MVLHMWKKEGELIIEEELVRIVQVMSPITGKNKALATESLSIKENPL